MWLGIGSNPLEVGVVFIVLFFIFYIVFSKFGTTKIERIFDKDFRYSVIMAILGALVYYTLYIIISDKRRGSFTSNELAIFISMISIVIATISLSRK